MSTLTFVLLILLACCSFFVTVAAAFNLGNITSREGFSKNVLVRNALGDDEIAAIDRSIKKERNSASVELLLGTVILVLSIVALVV